MPSTLHGEPSAGPPTPSPGRQALALAIALGVCFTAAGLGAIASAGAPAFYAQLQRPAWAPPAGLFGPVWTVLYALMAVSAWLVWRTQGVAMRTALAFFAAQLVANAAWSWLFFAWRLGAFAFADVLLLWLLLAATIVRFWRLHRGAAVLLLPYLAWVTYAAALTWSVWQRNPGLLG
ncbi:TspO/MBR family protein [Ramlibacter rhizophilus]|uniref:Tryptophan-rich sensory protein n=1 Tax=Ramlibacter rhizophilus TaxID=1781167 RepID=A0A4Z0BNY6_9BURK|nr:TspO/MBR family protein [Ramlibacter rhizophilus]TFZ01026.1 tryptophan-rich sensory protein [Ramlibacter rhizophilus]